MAEVAAGRSWIAIAPLGWLVVVCCGPGLPSKTPLGGEEEIVESPAGSEKVSTPPSAATAGETSPEDDGEAEEKPSGITKTADEKGDDASSECKPSEAPAPSCAAVEAGPCADAFGKVCHWVAERFLPEVASTVVTCLNERNRHSECEALVQCIRPALDAACVEAPAREWCQGFLKRCPTVEGFDDYRDQSTCERVRSALSEASRDSFDTCLGDGCDVAACVDELDPDAKHESD